MTQELEAVVGVRGSLPIGSGVWREYMELSGEFMLCGNAAPVRPFGMVPGDFKGVNGVYGDYYGLLNTPACSLQP